MGGSTGYVLGIDLGDTRTRAAVARGAEHPAGDGEAVRLDSRTDPHAPSQDRDGSIGTVLHIGANGSVLAGRAAAEMAERDPQRVARGFVSRVGDTVPVVLPDGPYPPEVLAATLAGWVADEVAAIEGAAPDRVVVTHPSSWGTHRRGALHAALEQAGLPGALLMPDAVAAAHAYARDAHVGADDVLAFGRVGRTYLDAALVRATATGFDVLAPAGRLPSRPGARVDDLLVEHVLGKADHEDPATPNLPGGVLVRLRAECEQAKCRLSREQRTVLPAPGPGGGETVQVELSRAEFEQLARPVLRTALDTVRHSVRTAGAEEPVAVLLAGGAVRMPLVRELGGTLLGDRFAVESDPGTTVCRGAALAACAEPERPRPPAAPAAAASTSTATSTALVGYGHREHSVAAYDDDPVGPAPPRPPIEVTTLDPPKRGRKLRLGKRTISRRAQEEP